MDEIRQAATPLLTLIPVYGPVISAVTNLVQFGLIVVNINLQDDPTLKYVKFQFDDLNVKLDEYHKEQKWSSWARRMTGMTGWLLHF